MKRISLAPTESHVAVLIEKTAVKRRSPGRWLVTIHFSITNKSGRCIRVININATKFRTGAEGPSPLTIGARTVVDLTIRNSLIDSNRYYEIEPGRQESVVASLDISQWFRVPTNEVDAQCSFVFGIEIDYHGDFREEPQLLRVSIPVMFGFTFVDADTPQERALVCYTEDSLGAMSADSARDQLFLDGLKLHFEETRNVAHILTQPGDSARTSASKEEDGALLVSRLRSRAWRASPICVQILHISDIHLSAKEDAHVYGTQLVLDLRHRMLVDTVDYLVISGDITKTAARGDYDAALMFLKKVQQELHLPSDRLILVPGNHDLSWKMSQRAYMGGKIDCAIHKARFRNFRDAFYNKIRSDDSYSLEYEEQYKIHRFEEHKLLFLCLNSSWQIDHQAHNRDRASINMVALSRAIDEVARITGDEYLKIAVFHHPLSCMASAEGAFIQQLAVLGFRICLHGHIHRAVADSYFYDYSRNLHLVGAGTFGASAEEQVTGIPHQYNLIRLHLDERRIRVETRKKEDRLGAWGPDARWPNRENSELPVPWYEIDLKVIH